MGIYVEILIRAPMETLWAHTPELHQRWDLRFSRIDYLPRESETEPHKTWGPLFGYRGSFEVEWRTVDGKTVPSHILPCRQERRE